MTKCTNCHKKIKKIAYKNGKVVCQLCYMSNRKRENSMTEYWKKWAGYSNNQLNTTGGNTKW